MLALEVLHEVQDLGLDRDVERRDRLVGDDEPRVERERTGEADALALAAGELVGVAVGRDCGSRPTDVEQLVDPLRSARRVGAHALDRERLGDDLARPASAG